MNIRHILAALFALGTVSACTEEAAYATPPKTNAPSASATATGGTGIGIGIGGGAVVNNNPVINPVNNNFNSNYMAPFIAPAAINEGTTNNNSVVIQGSAPNWMSNSGNLEAGRTELTFGLQMYGQDQGPTTFAGTLQLRHVFATPADRQMGEARQRQVDLGNQLLEAQLETERARAELLRQQAGLVGAQTSGQVLDNLDRLSR